MLNCIRVQNLAIIEALEVEFAPGLNVITGETGAGKSILITALDLVLGGKASSEIVRAGAEKAEVEALFDISKLPSVQARLKGLELEEADELIVRRVIQAQGRSRAYINGRMATQQNLRTLAAGLADISSQHQHHSLTDPRTHLASLDAFAKLEKPLAALLKTYREAERLSNELSAIQAAARDRADREDLLRFQLNELEEADPQPGEEESLESERGRLRHAETLASAATGAESQLYAADRSVSEQIAKIIANLERASELDATLRTPLESLRGALSEVEDAAAELGTYARNIQVDPIRLDELDQRAQVLARLSKKYGGTLDAAILHREEASAELLRLESVEEAIESAEANLQAALSNAAEVARKLSQKRQRAAGKLGKAISNELASLGMGGAKVVVELAKREARDERSLIVDGARLSPTGIDRCEMLIAPNKGEEAKPLGKIASGGELSRALLAIKRVLGQIGSGGTYIFDEVDTGVGGAIAEVIGRKLVEVAEHHQVICITHHAQIAVYGDAHLLVQKNNDGHRTRSEIALLSSEERAEEVARMIGGMKITKKTRAAAEDLLEQAQHSSHMTLH